MHAEALAKIAGLETATFTQSFLLELSRPGLSAMDLLQPELQPGLIPIISCTDCCDLHETLIAPALSSCSNKHLSLYLSAIREFKTLGRISSFVWLDTRDMCANGLTKLGDDGTVETAEIESILKTFSWKLQHPFRWNNTWSSDV